jgi:Fatty acid cis/trans isomerase (CTI)
VELTRLRLVAGLFFGTAFVPFACGSPPQAVTPLPPPSTPALTPAESAKVWSEAQAVFENRCVVCHGCYDAPCQLKLGTFDGIARGASSDKVYDSTRVIAASPTRLDVDAHDAEGWRKKGFHPVLPEGAASDPRASVLLQMLDLKRRNPLPVEGELATLFTLDLDRKETCTTADHFEAYAKNHPLWGMPYALPGLGDVEDRALVRWVTAGAPHPVEEALGAPLAASIAEWETFLNEPSPKSQLVARYIYEHLFLASLYFQEAGPATFFRLVRSRTASGTAVDEIPTRRPFDDPETARVYYRVVRRLERPLEKTLMPYPLSAERLRHFQALFLEPKYAVDQLPSYDPAVASNPFRAFQAIPAEARYRFMLEEAEFTMMGFIKGPVCRGQVALDAIEDRFWITFLRPDVPWMKEETDFLAGVAQDLAMPAEGGSTALPTLWLRYGGEHARYVARRTEFLEKVTKGGEGVTPRLLWDGGGSDANASLTVFRHFDSASVVKGLVGSPPKTAWVVGYPLLERIHYLLVAGFDVFGNVSHQVTTRLYMDFLRMEGEADFLMFLPAAQRRALTDAWYRGVTGAAKEAVARELDGFTGEPKIAYRSHDPREAEKELFALIQQRVAPVLPHTFDLQRVGDGSVRAAVEQLARVKGIAASLLPEMSFLTVTAPDGARESFTILRDSGHTNVAHLFREDKRRLPAEDELTVVPGFLGAYPNALFEVQRKDLPAFVDAAAALADQAAYDALRRRFGVLRSSDRFWPFSDAINADHRKHGLAGLFDYNRLEGL